jgi:hypothetical protein
MWAASHRLGAEWNKRGRRRKPVSTGILSFSLCFLSAMKE